MPNTLNLQQCLTVCRHYESLSLHIQQIHSGSDRQVEFLRKHHPKAKKYGQNKSQLKGQNLQKSPPSSQQKATKFQKRCYGCGRDLHNNCAKNCPAWGSTYRKCNKPSHWEIVCGQVPRKSTKRRQSGERSMVSEVRNSNPQTVPKQVLDIVDMANSVDNLSHCYKRQVRSEHIDDITNTIFFKHPDKWYSD